MSYVAWSSILEGMWQYIFIVIYRYRTFEINVISVIEFFDNVNAYCSVYVLELKKSGEGRAWGGGGVPNHSFPVQI